MRFPSDFEMRAPFELGWSPSRASSTPAFVRASLYRIILSIICLSGSLPASAFSPGCISIINRIVVSPMKCEAGRTDERAPRTLPNVVDRLVSRGPETEIDSRWLGVVKALGCRDRDDALERGCEPMRGRHAGHPPQKRRRVLARLRIIEMPQPPAILS